MQTCTHNGTAKYTWGVFRPVEIRKFLPNTPQVYLAEICVFRPVEILLSQTPHCPSTASRTL